MLRPSVHIIGFFRVTFVALSAVLLLILLPAIFNGAPQGQVGMSGGYHVIRNIL